MLPLVFPLFFLQKFPFERYAFPRWQAVLAITFLGLLAGLDSDRVWSDPEALIIPSWLMLSIWGAFLVSLGFLRWWLKRGGRWDGRGDLFNLLAASYLVADTLCIGLMLLDASPLLILPLGLYSIWVAGNALSGAIPKASLDYSIGGFIVSQILIALLVVFLFAALFFALVLLVAFGGDS